MGFRRVNSISKSHETALYTSFNFKTWIDSYHFQVGLLHVLCPSKQDGKLPPLNQSCDPHTQKPL